MKKQKIQRLRERTMTETESGNIDRDNCVIRNCALLGSESRNNRVYELKALQDAVGLYEGAVVRVNHNKTGERSVTEDIGVLRNITLDNGKVRGDFHYFNAHPHAEYFCERAEKSPETFGFSHESDGVVEVRDGVTYVTDLVFVESVDLVGTPATNSTLFEERTAMSRKLIRSIIRSTPKSLKGRNRLLESIADKAFDGEVEVPEDATPEVELDAAIKAAVMSVLTEDGMSTEEKLAKIAELCGTAQSVPENEVDPDKKEEIKPLPEEGDDAEKKLEDDKTKALQEQFDKRMKGTETALQNLTETLGNFVKQQQAEQTEKSVKTLFEDVGVNNPTREELAIASSLTGVQRENYAGQVKALRESEMTGGLPQSGARLRGGAYETSAYPEGADAFAQALRQ